MSAARGPIYTPVELLARLVAFDTTSYKNNLGLIAFVEDYLLQHGVVSRRIVSDDGQKSSLYATIGPQDEGGVALSGHTDVVPVDGQTWTSDPFTLRAENGKLYGRGSADMKSFLAASLAAVPDYKKRALKKPIHLAFSYDEEIGCIGVRPMIAELGKELPRPRMVIVGEPTSMQVVDAHKGPVRWQVDVKGRAAHSSMAHLGVNAVTYATRLIGELERMETELKQRVLDVRFEPPYSTLQVTKIEGGTATNIVPAQCSFVFDIRALPGLDPDEIENRLRRFAEKRCLEEMRAIASGGRYPYRARQRRTALRRRTHVRGRRARLEADRTERDVRRLLWNRGGPFSGCRRTCRRLRTGRYRSGAHRRRMDRRERDQEVHGLPWPARRMGRDMILNVGLGRSPRL